MAEVSVSNVNFRKGGCQYFSGLTLKNTTGASVDFVEGQLLQFDATDGKYIPYAGGSEDKPVAILGSDVTIGAASETTISACIAGDVNSDGLTLPGVLTIDSVPTSSTDAIAIAAGGSNTGNGVAGAVTAGANVQAGDYLLTCYDASASGSEIFSVFDPSGSRLADLTVAVAYDNSQFAVTIADGATDFIVGDTFTVTATVETSASASIRLMLKDTMIIAKEVEQMVS